MTVEPGPPPRHRALARAIASLSALVIAACAESDAAPPPGRGPADAEGAGRDAPRAELALPVQVADARDGDLVLRVATTGQIRAETSARLRFEVAGTVDAVLVRPGARVARGQPLVRLDPYPFELAIREARAAADEAEQRYLESVVPESLVTGRGPTDAQRKALRVKSGLDGALVRLERARHDAARATLASRFDGDVDAVDVAVGDYVTGGQAVLTVVDTRHLRVEAQVLEHDLPLVRAGGEATITTAGAPGRVLHGRVDALLPLVDSATRSGRALVRWTGDGVLRPGMYADVQLEAARLRGRRLVPAQAVIERDGRPLVFVVEDGRARWTYVRPGRSNGVETELLPDSATGRIPVDAGAVVITEGHLTLAHDAPVRVERARVRPAPP